MDSVRRLEEAGWIDKGVAPTSPPESRPRFDDDAPGISFFRTLVEDGDFANLTLPGLYFASSQIERCTFRNADLRYSTLCWNDFVDVDFSGACLIECDLRAAVFERCNFAGANLQGALVSTDCSIVLSAAQRELVVWSDEEPDGG